MSIRIAAIIPARMGSSRFPGKPLLVFHGLPMVEHVRRRAVLSGAFADVVVATCDREIAGAVEQFGGVVVMTAATHEAATDRVAEAMQHLDCTHVVNVQGDEILVLPQDLGAMAAAIRADPAVPAWNALAAIEEAAELKDRSIVKCVVSTTNRVLFCSRDFSALPRRNGSFEPVRKILGILAYERGFLARYSQLPRTPLELAESIDQSRIVENDVPLRGVPFTRGYAGINEPREVTIVERALDADPLQRWALAQVLSI